MSWSASPSKGENVSKYVLNHVKCDFAPPDIIQLSPSAARHHYLSTDELPLGWEFFWSRKHTGTSNTNELRRVPKQCPRITCIIAYRVESIGSTILSSVVCTGTAVVHGARSIEAAAREFRGRVR